MHVTLKLCEIAKSVGLSSILTFRPYADEMYKIAIEQIRDVTPNSIISCSFASIEICDVSFVDQFLINLQLHIHQMENIVLCLEDLNDDVISNIEGALYVRNEKVEAKNRIALLCFSDGCYSTLGRVEQNVRDTLDFLQHHPEGVTARELMEHENLEEINSASNRLKKLFTARFVCRRPEIIESGRQHVYFIPSK